MPADTNAERRRRKARRQVEQHSLPQHAPGILLAVSTQILRDLDRKGIVQAHQNAV